MKNSDYGNDEFLELRYRCHIGRGRLEIKKTPQQFRVQITKHLYIIMSCYLHSVTVFQFFIFLRLSSGSEEKIRTVLIFFFSTILSRYIMYVRSSLW